ncbi:hypothetical protein ACUVLF_004650, partial [Salmonella enterica subsp. enterica serovar Chester]
TNKKTAAESGQDTSLYYRHTVGTPNILVRAAPRHPRQRLTVREKFRVPLTVPELVKQKIVGSRASGVGSDFVIDDGTGKTLGMVVGVTECRQPPARRFERSADGYVFSA